LFPKILILSEIEQILEVSDRALLEKLTRNPLSDLISMMVNTVSYKTELPTFFVVSVFVAT